MNGALMKASSRFAIAAALGFVVGVGSVRAADLGGNCCADLEERIAELEAGPKWGGQTRFGAGSGL